MATNLELAGKVARFVELESINLRHAKVEVSVEPIEMPEEVNVDVQYRTSIEKRQSKNQPTGLELAVSVDLRFQVQGKMQGESIQVVSLEASYLLVYLLDAKAQFEDECLKHFSEVNGPYNTWPYWRELVQSTTGRVGLPGFIVPVFRPIAIEVDKEIR